MSRKFEGFNNGEKYENYPRGRMSVSGGGESHNPRERRGKTPNKGDSWFSQSFANAGGLQQNLNNGLIDQRLQVSNESLDREEQFKMNDSQNSQLSVSGVSHKPLPYRGSKTAQYPPNNSDWDFLATLNDILRKENFLIEEGGKSESREPKDEVSRGSNVRNGFPLSPRPPRPARRSDRRKMDYTKTRSMDASESMKMGLVEFGNIGGNCPPLPLGPPPDSPSYMNNPHNPQLVNPQLVYQNSNHPQYPSNGNLSKASISSSLDSIYDRLKSSEMEYSNGGGQRATLMAVAYPPNYVPGNYPQAPGQFMHHHNPNDGFHYGKNGGPVGFPHLYETTYGPPSGKNVPSPHLAVSNNSLPTPAQTWMMPDYRSRSYGSFKGSLLGLDYEDRLLRLESDKDTLHLQVSVLSDQIEAQTSKIQDLEKMLDDKRIVLDTTEDQLQRELLTRSSLETQKLELLTEISSMRLKHASLERENLELKDRYSSGKSTTDLYYQDGHRMWEKPPLGPVGSNRPISPLSHNPHNFDSGTGPRPRPTNNEFSNPPPRNRTPPANAFRRVDQQSFGTLPRRAQNSQLSTFNGNNSSPDRGGNKGNSMSSGNIHAINFTGSKGQSISFQQSPMVEGDGGANAYPSTPANAYIQENSSGHRSTSAPNLAAIERDDWQRRTTNNTNSNSGIGLKSPTSGGGHKSRGIMRILGKLKRSNSGGLDNDVAPAEGGVLPFSRGGLRATAAPRLGWMRELSPAKKPDGPITSWDSDAVVTWLNYLGLGMYANEVKRWVKTGQQLLDASTPELEKELGVKNILHRKKLALAIHSLKNPDEEDAAGRLDYHWVIRWLDDVGLPQYKESFAEARIDGRVLGQLTAEDLISLKVTSVLHHASIKRGIQLLRIHRFNPGCLCRRSGPNSTSVPVLPNGNGDLGLGLTGPKYVATWTNHRVMEWLKAIDLAEYAPNLRGSGVHGALIIFEPRFNSELLSVLLSIPNNKTLLRRHLTLQFSELLGRHIVQEKRVLELASEFVPINPTTKVKISVRSKFPLRRKRMSSEFSEDPICPLDWNVYPFKTDSLMQLTTIENLDEEPGNKNGGDKISII